VSRAFFLRLWLDCLAAGLLFVGLAYWWLGNVVHEVVGTAMFVLLTAHNVFNRRWYRSVTRTRREPRSMFNVGVTFALLIAMLTLFITSVLISNTLSAFLPAWGGFTVRQVHTLAAYWVLVIVAVHLGLRWPMLMGIARNLFGITKPNIVRTTALRVAAIAVAIHGIWSANELGLGTKLSMRMTLDWWNFEEAVAGFFFHCIAVAGLVVSATYYGLQLPQRANSALAPARVAVGAEPRKPGGGDGR
jgi:Na+/proline symporter